MATKLIILRGPSGSGKSTIASKLLEKSTRKIATIEQDMFRHKILHEQEGARQLSATMVRDTVVTALSNGYDVICDGIFNISHYREMFDEIIKNHQSENYIYYLDISFDETLKRHKTRDKNNEFGKEEMRKWYQSASPIGYKFETRIDESYSLDKTVKLILQETGL